LLADADSSPHTVFINNIPIISGLSNADPDNKSPDIIDGGDSPHDDPYSAAGSPTVFCYNKPAHRNGDPRACGATTIVSGQSSVFLDG
jgi:uncharacterized Zn-binding protein involved in type VI secretion